MTDIQILGLAVLAVCTFLVIRIVLDLRQRILITVSRPTTTDGEQVQVTTNIRASAGAPEVAAQIEKASLSIQHRMAHQNQIVAETDAQVAHGKWLRIRSKLDQAEKEHRKGLGVLTKAERGFWMAHANDFDQDGPIIKPDRVAEAAHGDIEPATAEG
jgi:hypothetical protein